MTALAIILTLGAAGIVLLKTSFTRLSMYKKDFHAMSWQKKLLDISICITGLIIGSILVLLFIIIPAGVFETNMDFALLSFIFAMPYYIHLALSTDYFIK